MEEKDFYYIESLTQYIRLSSIQNFRITDPKYPQKCIIKMGDDDYIHTEASDFYALESILKSK